MPVQTFLIAAFVLAPEGGIAYYFFNDVAPINPFIGPLLSVISLLFFGKNREASYTDNYLAGISKSDVWSYSSGTKCLNDNGWTVLLLKGI